MSEENDGGDLCYVDAKMLFWNNYFRIISESDVEMINNETQSDYKK